jgi:hypothetical protein
MKKLRKLWFIWLLKILIQAKVNLVSCSRQIYGLNNSESTKSFRELINVTKLNPNQASILRARTTLKMAAVMSQIKLGLTWKQKEVQMERSNNQSYYNQL